MKIGVLTSSRADFGIYLPLLNKLKVQDWVDLEIIAFGTHTASDYGHTIDEIESYDFKKISALDTLSNFNTPLDISESLAKTSATFSPFWADSEFDLVFCLGDRYEMFAAVSSASPFNLNFAHIHAGETTLGAIDNAYRHSISLFSKMLFVCAEPYRVRATDIVGDQASVYDVGALSIDNLSHLNYMTNDEFQETFGIDMSVDTILCTIHPETVNYSKNEGYVDNTLEALEVLSSRYQVIITLPNTDTMGQMMRDKILDFGQKNSVIKIVESFGMRGYLSCMKLCSFMLGNSSSGFIEASYFPKWVINLGDRQSGRIITPNILSSNFEVNSILKNVTYIESHQLPKFQNIYGDGHAADKILEILEEIK